MTPEDAGQIAQKFYQGANQGAKFGARNFYNALHNVATFGQGLFNAVNNTINYPLWLASKKLGWNYGIRTYKPQQLRGPSRLTKFMVDKSKKNLKYLPEYRQYMQTNPWMRGIQIAQQESIEDALTGKGFNLLGKGIYRAGKALSKYPIKDLTNKSYANSLSKSYAEDFAAQPGRSAFKNLFWQPLTKPVNQALLKPSTSKWRTAAGLTGATAAVNQAISSATGAPEIPKELKKYQPAIKQGIDAAGWLNPGVKSSVALFQHTPFGPGFWSAVLDKYTATPEKARNMYYFARKLPRVGPYLQNFQSPTNFVRHMKNLGANQQNTGQLAQNLLSSRSWKDVKKNLNKYTSELSYDPALTISGVQPTYRPQRRALGYHGNQIGDTLKRNVPRIIGNAVIEQGNK